MRTAILTVAIGAAMLAGGIKAEDIEPPSMKLGGQNVIYSDHHISSIVPGDSYMDRLENERAREQQESLRRSRDTIGRDKPRNQGSGESSRDDGLKLCREKLSEEECQDLDFIITHESSWNQYIKNGRCCGLFQRYDRCSDEILSDFNGQMSEGMVYILQRYGTAREARYFWEVTAPTIDLNHDGKPDGRHWY